MTRITPGEPEALRICRHMANASTDLERRMAANVAKAFLRTLTLRPTIAQAGAPCRIPRETLRRISNLHLRGMTQQQIADQLRLNRHQVKHHLKPSAAMIAAMID